MAEAKPLILAIDDEADVLETYRSVLGKKHKVVTAPSGKAALKELQKEPVSVVLLDIRMPAEDGIQVLKKIKAYDQDLEVIMVTASKDIASAVEAMKLGAFDYVSKPFDVKELQALIHKAIEKRELVRENLCLRQSLEQATSYFDLIGKTPAMQELYQTIDKVGPADSTVLIHGESGTGKELVARAIHKKSRRVDKPFVAVNCAAIPENLFESDLFGHERGAFTGALDRKLGKFELAHGGSLFLDEIGCMPAALQAKLLRVLEDRVIERVGGEKGIPVDVRIISATNIDFEAHIREGRFRHDLYYRLNVIPITLPPLRDRKEDIPLFVEYFLDKFNKTLNRRVRSISKDAMQALMDYAWPGNVRELQNLVERLVVLSGSEVISGDAVPVRKNEETPAAAAGSLKETLEDQEKRIIQRTLDEHDGNITRAAEELKLARTSLTTRMKNLGMVRGRGPA